MRMAYGGPAAEFWPAEEGRLGPRAFTAKSAARGQPLRQRAVRLERRTFGGQRLVAGPQRDGARTKSTPASPIPEVGATTQLRWMSPTGPRPCCRGRCCAAGSRQALASVLGNDKEAARLRQRFLVFHRSECRAAALLETGAGDVKGNVPCAMNPTGQAVCTWAQDDLAGNSIRNSLWANLRR